MNDNSIESFINNGLFGNKNETEDEEFSKIAEEYGVKPNLSMEHYMEEADKCSHEAKLLSLHMDATSEAVEMGYKLLSNEGFTPEQIEEKLASEGVIEDVRESIGRVFFKLIALGANIARAIGKFIVSETAKNQSKLYEKYKDKIVDALKNPANKYKKIKAKVFSRRDSRANMKKVFAKYTNVSKSMKEWYSKDLNDPSMIRDFHLVLQDIAEENDAEIRLQNALYYVNKIYIMEKTYKTVDNAMQLSRVPIVQMFEAKSFEILSKEALSDYKSFNSTLKSNTKMLRFAMKDVKKNYKKVDDKHVRKALMKAVRNREKLSQWFSQMALTASRLFVQERRQHNRALRKLMSPVKKEVRQADRETKKAEKEASKSSNEE